MLFYLSFLVAMFTAIVLIPPLTYIYKKLGIVDFPSARKIHRTPIPRVGGVAIVIASIIPIAKWLNLDIPLYGVLVGMGLLFVLGIADDARNLNYKIKFIVQIIAISIIFIFGFIDISKSYYFSDYISVNAVVLGVYFFFILGVTNAINLSDGLDGLAGGEALLSFSIIGLLAYESNNITVLIIVLAVIGSIFGFLRFNTYPARIFMGDTGSLFLGFVLGLLSIALTYGADNAYAKFLPLLLVGLPLFDTLMVIIIRLSHKQSPFNADRNHLHHKLLDNGFKHYQSVLVIYIIQSIFVVSAYFLRYSIETYILLTFLVISVIVISIESASRLQLNMSKLITINITSLLNKLKIYVRKYTNIIFIILSSMIFIYSITSSVIIEKVNNNIMMLLSCIILVMVAGGIIGKNKACGWIERIAIHIMIVLSIYLTINLHTDSFIQEFHIGLLLSCIGLIIIMIFGSNEKRFIGSPLDFLLIATAVAIPNLPNSPISESGIGVIVLKLIVLFYCVEYILFNVFKSWWIVRAAVIVSASLPIIFSIS